MSPKFEIVYKGKMFEVVRWEGKPGKMFEAAVRSPGVRVIIECEKDGQKALCMTSELRREAGGWDYRLPGGKVFDLLDEFNKFREEGIDMGEKAKEAAMRESREEAGLIDGKIDFLEISTAGASVEWDLHYFLVTDARFGEQQLEEDEQGDIKTVVLTGKEIFEKLVNREVKEGRSADMLWWWLEKNKIIKLAQ